MSAPKIKAKIADTVNYKKVSGSLMLLDNQLLWQPSAGTAGGKRFTCLYSDIKVQRISPETSSSVKLQILLKDDTSNNFQFSNPQGRAVQMQERNVIKDLLAELIPLHREKANKDLEEKNKIFMEQPELYQLYKDLVVSNIITADEFWEKQSGNIKTDHAKKQEVGISSGVLAEIKPDMHGCNELRFNLTADTIEAIFKMYPEIRQRYINQVPHETSEKEFWTEFFKSKHFHRDRSIVAGGSATAKDVFGELAKKDETNTLTRNVEAFSDPLINFTSPSPHTEEGYGHKGAEKTASNHMALIKQFNHQSMMVLERTKKRGATGGQDTTAAGEERRKRIRAYVEYSELEEQVDESVNPVGVLRIDKSAFNAAQNTDNGDANGHSNGDNDTNGQSSVHAEWAPCLSQVLAPDVAKTMLTDLSPGGKCMPHMGRQQFKDAVPDDTLKEMKKVYLALAELLRHFWSCFPTKTPQLEEKVSRMATAIESYRDTKLANFKCSLPSQYGQLSTHLDEIISAALKKFHAWEERKAGTKVNVS